MLLHRLALPCWRFISVSAFFFFVARPVQTDGLTMGQVECGVLVGPFLEQKDCSC